MTTIVVPAVKKCGARKKVVIPFVAADAGTVGSVAGLDIHCRNRKVIYFPIFDVEGKIIAYSKARAHPGDKVVLRMSWNTANLSLAVVDKTRPSATRIAKGSGSTSFMDPEIGDATIGNMPAPVPDFGKVTFSKSTVNGKALGLDSPLTQYNMVNSSHILQTKTGPIQSKKQSFTTTFEHS